MAPIYVYIQNENRRLRTLKEEMFTALQELLEHCGCAPQIPCNECESARAVIAKAKRDNNG